MTIACAGGQPTGFASPQFDVTDGPYQEEQDGRYWDYLVQLHEGVSFADNIQATWECPKAGGGSAPGGGAIAPGAGSSDTGAWQAGNGGKAQVAFAPKAGVETGFGGTARF
ncbi:hypothetical protein HFP15_37840 [Amycolatopsis sp. K13G38]|uniref:Uncharacterized protein n=1 Tax=Amycolatopsis acididurans TaxID=2724524 RepID=A0ABX1JFV7_9PSEU|nr:hypothetical protein [Amycolatopsis acididurans]NKQ58623.1 hypothetical protein [Amycolatopsis acididurans]